MSELKQYLDCFFCCSEQVKHLDGCDNGAYVINKDEMKKLLSVHSAEQDKVIGELVEFIGNLANANVDEYEISGQYGGIENITTISELWKERAKELLAKHKQSKGE